MSSPTAPAWLNNGDNAWQLTAASLVGLQSIPGLVVLYAGIVKRKWAINSAFMAFYAFAAVLICWVVWAYKMGFGEQWGAAPFVGTPGPVVAMDYELRQSSLPAAGVSQAFPLSTMVYFQFVFAAITVVIMAGAFLGRMNFTAWMVFVPLWITFSDCRVYRCCGDWTPSASGPRRHAAEQHPLRAGWRWHPVDWMERIQRGDPYTASPDAGAAVLNTDIATAMSTLVWTIMDIIFYGKPAVIGAVQGMITGLVAITPAAGVVAGWGAVIIGACSGSIPWISLNVLGKRVSLFKHVDDTLDVFHTHAVAGFLGGFLVGLFATKEGCAAFALTSPGGAIEGNGKQVWLQIVGALFIIALNLFMTPLILFFIKYVLRIPLRMPEEVLLIGDDAIHWEEAYGFTLDAHHSETPGRIVGSDPEAGRLSLPQSIGGNETEAKSNGPKAD
ncbi:Ammonium transporter [Rasamsonia emersonii CBS 393.64]|uniref:Ammonium transporter n=1 Tax=Rasamsonia emersonii (strain ATCC 16479 / CBS 393.64 / IMI 116815) TaxID=1408163 RepID=A0A0F4YVG1_RASE3|nr:Ammonium transporter [Rasamsonia emersonii CBS 393.64]KKA22095.1 Ammonium transporter [Rasamsonia emersonii CBS 393.64]